MTKNVERPLPITGIAERLSIPIVSPVWIKLQGPFDSRNSLLVPTPPEQNPAKCGMTRRKTWIQI